MPNHLLKNEKLNALFKTKALTKHVNLNNNLRLQSKVSSGFNIWLSTFFKDNRNFVVYVLADTEKAKRTIDELEMFLEKPRLLYFPDSSLPAYSKEEIDNANLVLRTQVQKQLSEQQKSIIVTTPKAIAEKLPTNSILNKLSFGLEINQSFPLEQLSKKLFSLHFNRVDFVNQPGDFAIRGGVVDVFSFAETQPFRLIYFDDEIEKIKQFDVQSQLSIKGLNNAQIVSNLSKGDPKRQSLLDLIPKNSLVILDDEKQIFSSIEAFYNSAKVIFSKDEKGLLEFC